ncbi:MAG: hypothetical protein ACTSU2_08565 [Promethearchaeota archaeon]
MNFLDNLKSFIHEKTFKLFLRAENFVLTRKNIPVVEDSPSNFSYFRHPVMQLGLPFENSATMLTPEGFLYNGSSELRYWLGIRRKNSNNRPGNNSKEELIPISKRIKSLKEGYLPEVVFDFNYEGINFKIILSFKIFQFWLDPRNRRFPTNFIKVSYRILLNNDYPQKDNIDKKEIINRFKNNTEIFLYIGYKYGSWNSDHRWKLDIPKDKPYSKFNKKWKYSFRVGYLDDNISQISALRDNFLIYMVRPQINLKEIKLLRKFFKELEFERESAQSKGASLREVIFSGIKSKQTFTQIIKINLLPMGIDADNMDQKVLLEIIYPHLPLSKNEIDSLNQSGIELDHDGIFEKYENIFSQFWNSAINYFDVDKQNLYKEEGMAIYINEDKVINTSRTSLIYNIMCQSIPKNHKNSESISKVEKDEIEQHVNRFQYNDFWLRDGSFFSRMYLMFGHYDISQKLIRNFMRKQSSEGLFFSQKGQFDGFGQVLWAVGEYFKFMRHEKKELKGDYVKDTLEFGLEIMPYMDNALKWFKNNVMDENGPISKDGLMPSTSVFDNEQISGKYTGHNIWALNGLLGLKEYYIYLDRQLSLINDNNRDLHVKEGVIKEILKNLELIIEKFKDNLKRRMMLVASKNKDFIPPGLNISPKIGIDWGNLLLLYPNMILNKEDPQESRFIEGTIDSYRATKYREGIATYTKYFLHHYITERVAQNNLVRNKQIEVLEDLYSMLAHTGNFNEGFEWCIPPHGNRDYYLWAWPIKFYNFPPHGWFAALYNSLLRNILIREDFYGKKIYMFSAISPEWVTLAINKLAIIASFQNVPTYFGKFSAELKVVEFNNKTKSTTFRIGLTVENLIDCPLELIFPLPFFIKDVKIIKATISRDGDELSPFNVMEKDEPENIANIDIEFNKKGYFLRYVLKSENENEMEKEIPNKNKIALNVIYEGSLSENYFEIELKTGKIINKSNLAYENRVKELFFTAM